VYIPRKAVGGLNIFTVLASTNRRFPEEQASAFLAWCLNPYADHGLGTEFLSRFVAGMSFDGDASVKDALADGIDAARFSELRTLRLPDERRLRVDLEYNVGSAFIDILVVAGDVVLALENKIYLSSKESGQLSRELRGLRKDETFGPCKKAVAYLLPLTEDDAGDAEYDSVKAELKDGEASSLVTWRAVREVINGLLRDEAMCEVAPVSEVARYAVKSFSEFIRNGFTGYADARFDEKKHGETTAVLPGIKADKRITYVGVQGGVPGLLRLFSEGKATSKNFQLTTSPEFINSPVWLTASDFIAVCDAAAPMSPAVSGMRDLPQILCGHIFDAGTITFLCRECGYYFHIGVRGGAEGLRKLSGADLAKKSWRIARAPKSSEWIKSAEFLKIIESMRK
jgi:hypothetical protein